MNEPESNFSAFISHASQNATFASSVCEELEKRGVRCWMAPRDVRPGKEYPEEISRAIRRSSCLVLLLSAAANESANVRREVELGVRAEKPIFPVRIEDVVPSPKIEFLISITQWIDLWQGRLASQIQILVDAIRQGDEFVSPGFGQKPHSRHRLLRSVGLVALAAFVPLVVSVYVLREVLHSTDTGRIADQMPATIDHGAIEQTAGNIAKLIEQTPTLQELRSEQARQSMSSGADSVREYLSHPGRDAFIDFARENLDYFKSFDSQRCFLPVTMSDLRENVVITVWRNHEGTTSLRPGDLIQRIGGVEVGPDRASIDTALARFKPGDTVQLQFTRNTSVREGESKCADGGPVVQTRKNMIEAAADENWSECIENAVMSNVYLGSASRNTYFQAHCARYSGQIGESKWNEQMFQYFILRINEGALCSLGDLERVGEEIQSAYFGTDAGRYSGLLASKYESAMSSVTRQ